MQEVDINKEKSGFDKATKKAQKRKKRFKRTILFVFILFVLFDFFLYFFATPVFKNYIQKKVVEKTKGLYSINFDKIRFEISQRHIKLTNFKLQPDTIVYQQLLKNNIEETAIYDVFIPSIELWGTSFYKLFFKQNLKVKEFFIQNPEIKLKKLPEYSQYKGESRDFIHQDLYPLINKYVDILDIKFINIENGRFQLKLSKDIKRNTSHFGVVSVKLFDFYLDKEIYHKTEQLFYSKDIQISISNYRILLSDKIHRFLAENIYISTKESLLKAKSVRILPFTNQNKLDTVKTSGYYYFSSPEIHFHNFNISNLYFNKNIEIQNIIIERPNIKLLDVQNKKLQQNKKVSKTFSLDFYKLIKGSLNSVSIKTIDLNHAELELIHHKNIYKPVYHIQDFNLSLLDFLLNEHSGNEAQRILYSKNIRLNLKNFKAKIIQNTHTLWAKQINIHTDTKSLYVKDLSIHPIQKTLELEQKMNFDISEVKLTGADFYHLIKKRELIIKKMVLGKSNIKLEQFDRKNNTTSAFMDKLTSAFLKTLKVQKIELKHSDFTIISYENNRVLSSYSGKLSLDLRYLNLYSGKRDFKKMFSVYRFKILLNNYRQQITDKIHVLNAESIYISNLDSLIKIKDLEIHPQVRTYSVLKNFYKPDIIDFSVENMVFRGIDMQALFVHKNLLINAVDFSHPLIKLLHFTDIKKHIEQDSHVEKVPKTQSVRINDSIVAAKTFSAFLFRYFKIINAKNLNIDKGIFVLSESDSLDNEKIKTRGRFSVKLKSFNYNYYADTLNYGAIQTQNLDIQISDFYRYLNWQPYFIKVKQIQFSQKDSLLSAKIVRWFPDNSVNDSLFGKSILTAYSPAFFLHGVDINRFSNANILNLGILHIVNPAISLISNKHFSEKKIKISAQKPSFSFEKIIFDSVIVSKGALGILNNKNQIDNKLLNTNFNLYLSQIQVDSSFLKHPLQKLKNVPTIIHLNNFKYQTADKKLKFDFKHFYLNAEKKIVLLDEFLYYTSKADNTENLFETVFIPAVKINNFSYASLLKKELKADSLRIIEPYFVLNNTEKKQRINPFEINLYEKTKTIFKKIDLPGIEIFDASLTIKNIANINKPLVNYNNIYGSITNLLIDSLHQNEKNKYFNTTDISFLMKNYSTTINNNFYQIDISNIGFSSGQQKVFAKGVSVYPLSSREELEKKAKTEIKLLYIDAPEINVHKADFKSFIMNREIRAQSIDLIDLKIHSFKNKHFPMDSVVKSALPFKELMKFKNYVKIDTINFQNFYVGVELLGENAIRSGYLDFTDINGNIINITNDTQLINNGLITKIKAHGKFMDEGFLTTSFRFPLNSDDGEYYYGGKLSRMKMNAFNPLLENLYFVSIRDGIIDSLEFTISANDDYAVGNMKFVYHNLKFDIHNKKKTDSLVVNKRGFVSMLANSIVKNDNPKHKRGRIRSAKIYYERDIYRSIFHYWAISVLSGIKTTMGFKSKELKERLKWEKIYEKNKRIFAKKEKKINRREKRKNRKEIKKDLKADIKREEREKRQQKIKN